MALSRIDRLSLLRALFLQVHVPQAVLDECLVHPHLPDAQRISEAVAEGLLTAANSEPLDMRGLGLGERCAIACALDLHAMLLVDDRAARRHAEALDVPVLGTLGLLVLAKRRQLVTEVRPLILTIRDGGHHISPTAMTAALIAANEVSE